MQSATRRSFLAWTVATAILTLLPHAHCHAAAAKHRFLAVDDGTHTLVHVDENDPARNWSVATGYVMDMQLLGQNRVLLNVDDGFREYDVASGKLLSSVKGAGGKSYSVYRASDGHTILTGDDLGGQKGACLAVYDRAGNITERKAFDGLAMLRHLRPTPQGTYLLAAIGQVVELDARWNIIRQTKLAGNLFKAVRLANGNVLCSSGPGARFLKELNPQGEVIHEIRGNQLTEGSFTGFQLLRDGHVMVANWLGHGSDHDGTVLVEYDHDGKLVWRYGRPHASFVEVIMLDGASEQGLTSAAVQEGKGHQFVCTDYSGGKVFIVNAEGKVEWEYSTGQCNDLWALPNGNLLFNTGHGVKEVTRQKAVVFNYESPSEIYACQRLTNGNTFVAECNAGRLLELAPDGNVVKEIRLLPAGKDGGHLYIRNARQLADGHYLVAHYGEQVVREYDSQGRTVREIPAPGGPHSVIRLPDGNTLIACGDMPGSRHVFEVDKASQTVWEVKGDDLPGIQLKFMAGLQRLPNGNTVMANWLGHGQLGKAPHLIEITRDKRVLWTYFDHQTMKTVSSVQLLDVPGDAIKGAVWH
jgi:catechol 2,3-dioxygenase-like lactoylglutathione lyase family enzyme